MKVIKDFIKNLYFFILFVFLYFLMHPTNKYYKVNTGDYNHAYTSLTKRSHLYSKRRISPPNTPQSSSIACTPRTASR